MGSRIEAYSNGLFQRPGEDTSMLPSTSRCHVYHDKSRLTAIPEDLTGRYLETVLERLFAPDASPSDQQLAKCIRTLAKYLRFIPVRTSNEDLEVLLAISIALNRERRK